LFYFNVKLTLSKEVNLEQSFPESLQYQSALIVDDNTTSSTAISKLLAHLGMTICTAKTGRQALGELEANHYRHVLLSAQVPDFDEVAEYINSKPWLAKGTIIMLTTTSAVKRQPGVRAYLTKPIIQSELFFAISSQKTKPNMLMPGEQQPDNDNQQTHAKILLAEDNLVNQKVAMHFLGKLGHEVFLVENGLQAVAAMEKEEYDLVLMDVQMPEMGGFEATARIRQMEQKLGKHTPIIAMTAHALHGDREKCIDAGMDDYVSKPIQLKQLQLTLDKYISQSIVSSQFVVTPGVKEVNGTISYTTVI